MTPEEAKDRELALGFVPQAVRVLIELSRSNDESTAREARETLLARTGGRLSPPGLTDEQTLAWYLKVMRGHSSGLS